MKLDIHPEAKALIFDLDGTLSDSIPVHIETWNIVCKKYNCTFNPGMIEELTGRPTIVFAERIISENGLVGVDTMEMVKLKQQVFSTSLAHLQPHPVVIALVHKYHGKLPMSIGTGANRRSAELQLKALGIYDMMDYIVSADDVTEHKPEPMTFLRCAELMQVTPKKCQVFEDGILGIQAAQTAGMHITDVRPFLNT